MIQRWQTFKTSYREFVLKQGEKLMRHLEKRIGNASLIGDTPFFDPQQFPWVTELEANWQTIRQELDALLLQLNRIPNFQQISVDQYDITQDDRWKTYFFYGYGLKAEHNCLRCPETTRLIEQVPGMKTAFFSILLPHKHIPEHCGPYRGVVRYHLALKVPQPPTGCGICVGGETRYWQEGKSLLFDDTFPHAAWNETEDIRVVLFLDFVRPLRFPDSYLNQAFIQLIAWSPYIQSGKQKLLEWEEKLAR
jgi:ornithine lipid ester-linked acyl 2-hydroxylase